jgi:predicted ferric reductase
VPPVRGILIWAGLAAAIAAPVVVAAASPLLAWRDPVYIASGFAGIAALALILLQPLLAGGLLPGLPARPGRRVHAWTGLALVAMVVAHVGGLWLTSAPDVIDALVFESPTPFSVWGVAAMWATFAAAALAALRWRLRLRPAVWRIGHSALAVVIVVGSVVHALLVEGAMGTVSKAAFCALVAVVTAKVLADLRAWTLLTRGRRSVNSRQDLT